MPLAEDQTGKRAAARRSSGPERILRARYSTGTVVRTYQSDSECRDNQRRPALGKCLSLYAGTAGAHATRA